MRGHAADARALRRGRLGAARRDAAALSASRDGQSRMIMRALVLAAGRGERMRPLTDATPKPLLAAGGRRLIEWQLDALAAAGIREIVINLAHLPDQFDSRCSATATASASRFAIRARANAPKMRSKRSAASCARCRCSGDAPFIVVSGDIVTDFDYASLAGAAGARLPIAQFDAHLVLVDNPPFHPRGDMGLVDGRIAPDADERLTYANIGVFAPRLFAGLQPLRARLFPWLYAAARSGRVSGEHFGGRWYNVGTTDELARGRRRAARERVQVRS